MSQSNCLFWALRQRWLYGGRLGARWSEHAWVPHFLWQPPGGLRDHWFSFVPVAPRVGWWVKLAKWRFEGEVRCEKRERRCG